MKFLPFCLACFALLTALPSVSAADAPVSNPVSFTGKFFLPADVNPLPMLKKRVSPRYPDRMRSRRVEGVVEIVFLVDEKGVPQEVQVATATSKDFGDAAAEAIRQWRYQPGKKDGAAVRVVLLQRLEFSVE